MDIAQGCGDRKVYFLYSSNQRYAQWGQKCKNKSWATEDPCVYFPHEQGLGMCGEKL